MNWKSLEIPNDVPNEKKLDEVEKTLREVASVQALPATPFAMFFPDMAYLKINSHQKKQTRVFSIIHNKEHENISWVMAESLRMAPEEDSLSIVEGYLGAYPNLIFDVQEEDLKGFVTAVQKIKSADDFQKLISKFGIRRSHPAFWQHYDELTHHQQKSQGLDFGYLDLTRYLLK